MKNWKEDIISALLSLMMNGCRVPRFCNALPVALVRPLLCMVIRLLYQCRPQHHPVRRSTVVARMRSQHWWLQLLTSVPPNSLQCKCIDLDLRRKNRKRQRKIIVSCNNIGLGHELSKCRKYKRNERNLIIFRRTYGIFYTKYRERTGKLYSRFFVLFLLFPTFY